MEFLDQGPPRIAPQPPQAAIFDVDPQLRYPYGTSTSWGGQLALGPNINLIYAQDPMAKTEMEKAAPGAMSDVMQLARVLQEAVVMALIR